MLQNRLYRGKVAHKEEIYPRQHAAIIEPELWQAVQDRLVAGRRERSMAVGAEAPSLLSGLIFDGEENRLSPTHAVTKGRRYRYYVSTALITGSRSDHPRSRRIPAGDIEGLVLDRLRALFASGGEISDAIAPLGLDAATQRAVLDRSAKLAERWTKLASLELRELVRSLVQQIQIGEAQILAWLNRTAIVSSVMPGAPPKPTDSVEPFVLSITASLRRAGKGVRLVIGNGAANAIDAGLASLIARAIATRNMFLAGRDDSIDAMASRLGVRRDYLAGLVRLSYLSALRHPVRYRRHAQHPNASCFLRNRDGLDRRRKIAAGAHPVPKLVQVVTEAFLESFNRFLIDARGTAIGLHMLIRLPYETFGNVKWLGHHAKLLPLARLALPSPWMMPPLRST